MIRQAIARVIEGKNLTEEEMIGVMDQIMEGQATPAQIGSFLTALRMKGETVAEITGAAKVMRAKATRINAGDKRPLVDTCGTGGDGANTFNVSTASAFVVAAAGIPVAKHGNRSVSSSCGSADVLEALGVNLALSPEEVGRSVREIGIGFLFAPALHGAMKHAIGPRRELGIRTIFNLLGPLTNPAGATVQVMGVYSPALTEPIATVLGNLGATRALVVCGEGNLDELTVTGATRISEWNGATVSTYEITPEAVGLPRCALADISGGASPAEAAALLQAVLNGQPGPRLDMTLLNSGAALMAAGKSDTLESGVKLARETVMERKAAAKLQELIRFSQENSGL